jgi:hypothetical protein
MADHGPSGSAGVLALLTVGLEAPSTLRSALAVREPRPTKFAACCHPIELTSCKAAPLQAFGVRTSPKKNTAPRIRWIRRAAVPPRTIRKNLRRHIASGLRLFQIIYFSIVPLGLVASCKNASFSPERRNVLIKWIFTCSILWRFEYISSLRLLSSLLSVTGSH